MFCNKLPNRQPRRTQLANPELLRNPTRLFTYRDGFRWPNNAFLAVEGCSNGFSGHFSRFFAWSFSMLLGLRFLAWGLLANGGLKLTGVDGVKTLD
jgi:hypothetical protein